ncbi:sodium/glutamate symporter [Mucisphaera calidilacus]|uniref:Sodium/glutamate symporter n=1 Tax=Mucisphaera calidilacus TaxID=2527982 RepID=A0A518BY34_9BACT|nr:sodium/glutamate symporter [Mucisphaera calidilacus]QDU71864.1 Sodium/glutamate symport carrier protein [Mucisphaera calidilacus]
MAYEMRSVDVLIVSVFVLYLGGWINRHVPLLRRHNIPEAVTGGIICSILVLLIGEVGGIALTFDLTLRDLFLLTFFSTIGLNARLSSLRAGGTALVVLVVLAGIFLIVQNATGVLAVMMVGGHPGFGLMGGSISFAGGHGTAIAWGGEATRAGLQGAAEFGVACATFGLITGGLIGGPIAGYLINKHRLQSNEQNNLESTDGDRVAPSQPMHVSDFIETLLALAVCISAGDMVNRLLFSHGVQLPGFLTAMVVGIVIVNTCDLLDRRLSRPVIDVTGEVSLQLFLAMSLMSLQLSTLASAAGVLLLVVCAQMLVITLVAVLFVFRLMGKDYDAAVITGGFVGLGLGATPVAMANMSALTDKYGPSTKAFLIIPLVGAFFIDLMNALVIKGFLTLFSSG